MMMMELRRSGGHRVSDLRLHYNRAKSDAAQPAPVYFGRRKSWSSPRRSRSPSACTPFCRLSLATCKSPTWRSRVKRYYHEYCLDMQGPVQVVHFFNQFVAFPGLPIFHPDGDALHEFNLHLLSNHITTYYQLPVQNKDKIGS